MEQFKLGDYQGGRDTLSAALGGRYMPLEGTMDMANAMAQQGLSASVSRQNAQAKALSDLMRNMMAERGQQGAAPAPKDKETFDLEDYKAAEEALGEEEAMMLHYQNIMDAYEPDSEEHRQAMTMMERYAEARNRATSGRRLKALVQGLGKSGAMDPFAQGDLGMARAQPVRVPRPENKKPPVISAPAGFEGEFTF